MESIYDFEVETNQGKLLHLSSLRNKVILIVNTASHCGFTNQYKDLEALQQQYGEQGLVILAFPCNQFAGQEPGNDEEIKSFCELNYGVSFPIMRKIDVNGANAHPLYRFLKQKAQGWFTNSIKWNFTKFLVSPDGKTIRRYAPITKPNKLAKDIEAWLGK